MYGIEVIARNLNKAYMPYSLQSNIIKSIFLSDSNKFNELCGQVLPFNKMSKFVMTHANIKASRIKNASSIDTYCAYDTFINYIRNPNVAPIYARNRNITTAVSNAFSNAIRTDDIDMVNYMLTLDAFTIKLSKKAIKKICAEHNIKTCSYDLLARYNRLVDARKESIRQLIEYVDSRPKNESKIFNCIKIGLIKCATLGA